MSPTAPSFLLQEKRWGRKECLVTVGASCGCNSGKYRFHSRYEHIKSLYGRSGDMVRAACYVTPSLRAVTFESPQALRASIPTPIGPSGHFPLIGGIGPLCPRGAFVGADAYISPADCTGFSEIFGEFVTSGRADVYR